jgi:hypothetical protein
VETVRDILAAHGSGISKPGLLAWARLRIDTKMTDAQLDEELAKLGDEVVDVDGFLYLRSVRDQPPDAQWTAGAPSRGATASGDARGSDAGEPAPPVEARWLDPASPAPADWEPPPARRRGLGCFAKAAGIVFFGFWVLGMLSGVGDALFGGSASSTPDSAQTPAPTPTIGTVIAFDEMMAGDCIVLPTESEFSEVRRVPCDTPHGGEIFLVADHPDGAYPTDDAFGEYVATMCGPAFQSWTGSAYEDQDALDYSWFTPTEESWTSGYRSFECYLAPADGSLADRSYRGANP